MQSALLADTILIIHAIYVAIVVLSVPLIIIGGILKWRWVHNMWFRLTPLAMIGLVVGESLLGIRCPLTVWENEARVTAQSGEHQDFVALWLDKILFYHFSHLTFTIAYVLFGTAIALLLFIVPVKLNPAGK